ncbi:MAG: hypothetical protein IJO81_06010 [Clostridia bacterium]|nr:hypothetical protein [Clostridia bacterium]
MKKIFLFISIVLLLSILVGCAPTNVSDESIASSQDTVDTTPETETESIDIFADVEPAEVPELPEELFFQPLDYSRGEDAIYEYGEQPRTLKELCNFKWVGYILLCDVVSDIDEYAQYENRDAAYSDLRVVRVIKGDCEAGDMFTVKESGTRRSDGYDITPDGIPLIRKNMRMLLFLMPSDAGTPPEFTKEGYTFSGLGAAPYLAKIYIDENNIAYPAASYIGAVRDYPVWECLEDFKEPTPLEKLLTVLDSYVK